jgi:hypothetical protein
LLWTFVEACVGGKLSLDECAPLFSLAGIGIALVVAVCTLAVLVLRRKGGGA